MDTHRAVGGGGWKTRGKSNKIKTVKNTHKKTRKPITDSGMQIKLGKCIFERKTHERNFHFYAFEQTEE